MSVRDKLECSERSERIFYGSFEGNRLALERDHQSDPWEYLVTSSAGRILAHGRTPKPTSLCRAIHDAIYHAGLKKSKPTQQS